MGYFDIPIEFSCPICGTKLSGKKSMNFEFTIDNATECSDSENTSIIKHFPSNSHIEKLSK